MRSVLPICFYPMRKIILDDDHAFSQSILLKMHGKNFTLYNSPKNALNHLLHEYQPSLTKAHLLVKDSNVADSSTQHIINIDLKKLNKMLLQSFHQDISVLFVDYHMPEMRGTDFLKEIQHLPIKKALITGENDYQIAIDAFNSGLVDAYLRKDDPDFSNEIQRIVSELEWKYFTELSSIFLNISDFDYLKNIHLINFFNHFIKENNVMAFCLSHIQGNFITQNIANKQNYFLVRSKSQLNELAKIAKEDGASSKTIKNLNQGKAIPFFLSKEYWEVPANEWEKFLYSAINIPDSNLVCAIVKDI